MKFKHCLAWLLAALMLLGACALPAFAVDEVKEISSISLRVSSRAAGKTAADLDSLVKIRTKGVKMTAGYVIAGDGENLVTTDKPMEKGQTYTLWLDLETEEGYCFSANPTITGLAANTARVIPSSKTKISVLVPIAVTGGSLLPDLPFSLPSLDGLGNVLRSFLGALVQVAQNLLKVLANLGAVAGQQ